MKTAPTIKATPETGGNFRPATDHEWRELIALASVVEAFNLPPGTRLSVTVEEDGAVDVELATGANVRPTGLRTFGGTP